MVIRLLLVDLGVDDRKRRDQRELVINLIGKKNMYLPSEFKSMLGGEYDARFAGTTYFEIVESGLIIPIKFCELVTS